MIRDTLNLEGDEDLEGALEAAFDIKFTDCELLGMINVGAINDVIDSRIPARSGACESSMAFYRLRRGLTKMGMTGQIRPETPLPPAFLLKTKDQFRALSKLTGLRLPPMEAGLLLVGCLLLGPIALVLFVVGMTLKNDLLGWLAAGSMVIALVLAKVDRGQLPKNLSTVGALAKQTSRANFGRLVRQGARVNSSLTWDILCEVIAYAADIEPDEIGRETLIYARQKAVA